MLIKLYEGAAVPDWLSICQCLMFLDDAPEVAKIFDRLLRGSQVRLNPEPSGARLKPLLDFQQSRVPA